MSVPPLKAVYWCNLNLREKSISGYKETDRLAYVGELEVTGLDDAFEKFNRIDRPVPILDEAEAPSMSVGDVVQILDHSICFGIPGGWFTVASVGFDPIAQPNPDRLFREEKAGTMVRRVIDGRGHG